MGRRKREVERLRQSLAEVKRENARLRRELAEAKRASGGGKGTVMSLTSSKKAGRKASREERMIKEAHRLARRFRKSSLPRYLWVTVTESAPAVLFYRLWLYLRRVRLIQTVLSVIVAAGALAAVTALSAAVLPFLVFGGGCFILWLFLRARHMNELLERELSGRRVRVLIPCRGGALRSGSFFIRSARAMAAEEGVAVLVVSPYLISRRGLGGTGGFLTARKEGNGVFLLRRHYYFLLRRRVLDGFAGEVTVVY